MSLVLVSIRKGASSTSYGQGYNPNPVLINAGDTVVWTNTDTTSHTITSGEDGIPDGSFDSSPNFNPILIPGQTFNHRFNKPGEYPYFCALHPNEVGVVIVEKTKDKRRKVPRRVEGPVHVHFFFVDIVGLSDSEKGGTESQVEKILVLQDFISKCGAYTSTQRGKMLINLTGDGMVIGFLSGPELPLKLAIELHKRLNKFNKDKNLEEKVEVRIGIHSAPILLYKDILEKKSVWGDGIILAKRIMDLGSAGDILLSDKTADDLKQFDQYRKVIDYVGEDKVKHGRPVKIYYAHGEGFGNAKPDLSHRGVQQAPEETGSKERKTNGPMVQIVNFGVEPPSTNAETTRYHPNLRNDDSIPVSNVRIYYKVMDRVVGLNDILKMEDEIKKQVILYEGSVLPAQSARVDSVELRKTAEETSAIFWLVYDFGDNESTEIIFDVRFKNYKHTRHIMYLYSDIARAKQSSQ